MPTSRLPSTKPSSPSPQITARKLFILLSQCDFIGGEDHAIEIMRWFAGLVLPMPKLNVVEQLANEMKIVRKIERNPNTENLRNLSTFYGLPMRNIAKIFSGAKGMGVSELRLIKAQPVTAKVNHHRPIRSSRPRKVRDYAGQLMLFAESI